MDRDVPGHGVPVEPVVVVGGAVLPPDLAGGDGELLESAAIPRGDEPLGHSCMPLLLRGPVTTSLLRWARSGQQLEGEHHRTPWFACPSSSLPAHLVLCPRLPRVGCLCPLHARVAPGARGSDVKRQAG